MKVCTKCQILQDNSNFSKDKSKSSGLHSSCKQCKKLYDKNYVLRNKEKIKVKRAAYTRLNTENKKIYDAERREVHREAINAKKREYYHATGKQKKREWIERNKMKVIAYTKTAKARRRSLEGKFKLPHNKLKEWLSIQLLICTYCSVGCSSDFHIDHIEPLSKGGEHSISNLTIACPSCNHSKGAKQLLHWLAIKTHKRN